MKTEDKEALGLKALQWKPLKPINKRLISPGQPLKEGRDNQICLRKWYDPPAPSLV